MKIILGNLVIGPEIVDKFVKSIFFSACDYLCV